MSGRKFAAFDIDGTIFRWQLYHELFDAFADEGIIGAKQAVIVQLAREQWRKRQLDYDAYEKTVVTAMKHAIVGLEEHRFNTIADRILEAKGHHTYNYSLSLLHKLKREGYVIIAISGSYQQLVDRFAALHGIDIAVGRNHIITDGRLTAESSEIFGQKDIVLRELITQHDLVTVDSYAVGDSHGDLGMLELVDNPIAFNPDKSLMEIAMKNGWKIVIERKSLAYELERGKDGTYLLAETNQF